MHFTVCLMHMCLFRETLVRFRFFFNDYSAALGIIDNYAQGFYFENQL